MERHTLRGAFDLARVRTVLAGASGYHEIVGLLDRSTHQLSVAEDLRLAIQTLGALLELGPGAPVAPVRPGDDIVRQSLFVHLVIQYCRSAHSQDAGRPKKGGVLKAYSPALRAAHCRTLKLRDKVIAHHGRREHQDWTDDRLVVLINGDTVRYRYVFERKLLTREALRDLQELLPVAHAHFRDRAAEVESQLNDVISERIAIDPFLWDTIADSPFNPKAYFGQGAIADNFEGDGQRGDVFGQIRWTYNPEA